jgi:hypothetical protein
MMKKQEKRTLVFYIVMAVAMSLPLNSFAQEKRGLFDSSNTAESKPTSMLGGGGLRTGEQVGVGNQGFNQNPAPLGSGVAMLIAAGAGYALLKSKKQRKN